VKIMEFWYYF